MSLPGELARTVRDLVARVLVDPVRGGRIRSSGWPSGLSAVVALAGVGLLAAVALSLASGALRAVLPLAVVDSGGDTLIPRPTVWIVFALTSLSVALVQAGAIHASAWVRWSITTFTALVILLMAVPDGGGVPVGRILAIAAVIGLVVLVAVRSRRSFRWWEFAIVLALLWSTSLVSIASIAGPARGLGYDFGPLMLSLVLTTIAQLAIPGAIAAGTAMGELTIATGGWTVRTVRARLGMPAVVVALGIGAVLIAIDLPETVDGAIGDPGRAAIDLAGAAIAIAVVWASIVLLQRLRPTGADGSGPAVFQVSGVLEEVGAIALAVAAILSPTILSSLGLLIMLVATSFGVSPDAVAWLGTVSTAMSGYEVVNAARGIGGIGLIAAAVVLARRGRRALPELLVAVGVCGLSFGLTVALGIEFTWTDRSMIAVAVVAAVALLAVTAIRGAARRAPDRSSTGRVTALAAIVLICGLFAHREIIADPVALLIGAAGVAVVLVGQLWNLFTGNAAANRDSPRYPRPTRVLIALGSALFALTVLAYGALARDPDAIVDLGAFAVIGDELFGHALLLCAIVAGLRSIAADRPLD